MDAHDKENLPEEEEPILLTEEAQSEEEGDEIIELTDELPTSQEREVEVIDLVDAVETDEDQNDLPQDSGVSISADFSLTDEQIERALEKVVAKAYGEKIEKMLLEVVQNKVAAEIEKIKKSFLDE